MVTSLKWLKDVKASYKYFGSRGVSLFKILINSGMNDQQRNHALFESAKLPYPSII